MKMQDVFELFFFVKLINLRYLVMLFSLVMSAFTFASPPTIALSDAPLYLSSGNVHPNLLLDLSVEYPTAKAAYNNVDDYNRSTEYLGYFNPRKCYESGGIRRFTLVNSSGAATIDTQGASSKLASFSDMQNGYFYAVKDTDANYECEGTAFSGNFMNWASASAIDMLRLALTGGDRVVDTPSQTILQRAFLPNGFYNSGYFVKKVVSSVSGKSSPERITPYKVSRLYVFNCDNKILFSDSDTLNVCAGQRSYPSNNAALDSKIYFPSDRILGEFLVRVQVCDNSENITRLDLCALYPSGNYKPVGNMQRNQNSMRFGTFGYLLDNTNTRYGGVLRAPMKYVGNKQFRAANGFLPEPNDRPEWDAITGVFLSNPEKDVSGNSGVINYLNMFGRRGNYKVNDPLSEMYYESIRYLQGGTATPASTEGMSADMQDSFQVISKWIDPVEASCQRNYVILIGDANTHHDTYIPGSTLIGANRPKRPAESSAKNGKDNPKLPPFDVKVQTDLVASLESTRTLGNLLPVPELANMATSYTGADAGTFYLAGTAYWAHTNDIRLDKPVRVTTFVIDVDENGNGSIDNVSRSRTAPRRSQLYLAAKYGGFNDTNGDKNPFMTFAKDGVTVVNNNNEWAASNQNDPDNFFLASDPKKMINAINSIFQSVASSAGTLAGVGISSTSASDTPFIYEPGFSAPKWSGILLKKRFDASPAIPIWNAAEILTGNPNAKIAPFPSVDARNLYTSMVNKDGALKTVPFIWNGGSYFSAADQLNFNTNQHTGEIDNLGAERINYLRGDRSMEEGMDARSQSTFTFRPRDSVLGDIISSTPVYYGTPAKNLSAPGYSKFYRENAYRRKAVYVGANDGFLHAFDADNGTELFAYAPNALLSRLSALTDSFYSHQSFVDDKIVVKDVLVKGDWKTVLVSGMGAGAKGLFALDVTDPGKFSSGAGALWEFTDKIDPDIGNILSTPLIAKFRVGGNAVSPIYTNYVIVSSGYNNYGATPGGSGNGAIFILSLDKMPGEPWVLNSNYFKLTTPIKDTSRANGLAAPNLVYGGDGAVAHLYVGDLQGNLWRFSFLDTSLATLSHTPALIFTAKTRSGKNQPITVQPQIVYAPGGGYILLFGTGKYLEANDLLPSDYGENSYYAILDTTYNADVVTSRSQLTPRIATRSGNGYVVTGKSFIYGVKSPKSKGWYLDFPDSQITGERIHHDLPGVVTGSAYSFNTMMLNVSPCSLGGGRKYAVDVLTGVSSGETGFASSIGLMSSPVLINLGTTVGDRNATGARRVTTKYLQRNQGPAGNEMTSLPDVVTRAGRVSWIEVQNFQELRKAAVPAKKEN